jgi:hypothetical protein
MRVALALLLLTCATVLGQSGYTDAMYRKAMYDDSTSPLYLLFTLHDPKSGMDRVVCTPGSGLVGAIHFERHLDFGDAGRKAAIAIALSQPSHRFTFRSRKALHTVEPHYSEAMLAQFRHRLSRRSRSQLIAAAEGSELDALCRAGTPSQRDDCQAAIAHVLLERGVLVGSADRTGLLFVER